jgi:pyruvate ferredoxin oxidoreductase gamma subunit
MIREHRAGVHAHNRQPLMIRCVRFHGRGGQGVKLGCRIVSRAAFVGGATVQDSPLYGAERRGAPVLAFARLGDEPIRERGYVSNPDMVVVMDDSLLDDAEAGVRDGIGPTSLVLVNSARASEDVRRRGHVDATVVSLDLSAIALELIGAHVLSAVAAALAAKAGGLAPWPALALSIAIELADAGLSAELIARNRRAARCVFDAAPVAGPYGRSGPLGQAPRASRARRRRGRGARRRQRPRSAPIDRRPPAPRGLRLRQAVSS